MNKENVKYRIIKQLHEPNPPIIDTMLHFEPWIDNELSPYGEEVRIQFPKYGLLAVIEQVENEDGPDSLQVVFSEPDPKSAVKSDYILFDGASVLKTIYAEKISCKDGKLILFVEKYHLYADEYIFRRTNVVSLHPSVYDIRSGLFDHDDTGTVKFDKWNALKIAHRDEYSEFRPDEQFIGTLKAELKDIGYPKDESVKLIRKIKRAGDKSFGEAHLTDIAIALAQNSLLKKMI